MNRIQTEIDLRLLERTALRLSTRPSSSDCLISLLPLLNRTRALRLVRVVLYICVTVEHWACYSWKDSKLWSRIRNALNVDCNGGSLDHTVWWTVHRLVVQRFGWTETNTIDARWTEEIYSVRLARSWVTRMTSGVWVTSVWQGGQLRIVNRRVSKSMETN